MVRPSIADRKAALDRVLAHASGPVKDALAKVLRLVGGALANEVAAAYRQVTKDDADKVRAILAGLDINLDDLDAEIRQELIDAYRNAGELALSEVLANPPQRLFDVMNPKAAEYAATRGAELVTQLEETTRADLRQLIEKAFTAGMSPAELSAGIRDSFSFSADRADMIARTELATAHIEGTLETWKESGVVEGKSAILSGDHDVEDECDDAEAMGIIPLDDDFGGLGDPPFHVNCACDCLPELVQTDEATAEG